MASEDGSESSAGVDHGGEPWWIVVAQFGKEDYASATVDAPDEETATAQGERVIVSNENRTPNKIANTRGPFPRHVLTEDREIRPKRCHGCGLKRFCGNHPPVPDQTWWRLVGEQTDEDARAWECIQCRTLTRMPREDGGSGTSRQSEGPFDGCPDCGGPLGYASMADLVCRDCESTFIHENRGSRHLLWRFTHDDGMKEVVARAE